MTPLLHIGYPKTASTWLQRDVFPRIPGVTSPIGPEESRSVLVFPRPWEFEAAAVKQRLGDVQSLLAERGETLLLSDERLSGAPMAGGYDAWSLGDRLAAVFDAARVLIVVREQSAMLASLYKHYVTWNSGQARPAEFIVDRPPMLVPSLDLAHFEYVPLIRRYRAMFGDERVLAIPMELISKDRAMFFSRLSAFLGTEVSADVEDTSQRNVGVPDSTTGLLRAANHLTRHSDHDLQITAGGYPLVRMPGRSFARRAARRLSRRNGVRNTSLKQHFAEAVGDRFIQSNRELAVESRCDLAGLGYRL